MFKKGLCVNDNKGGQPISKKMEGKIFNKPEMTMSGFGKSFPKVSLILLRSPWTNVALCMPFSSAFLWASEIASATTS